MATAFDVIAFLGKEVDFGHSGTTYDLLQPLTDFRECHDAKPAESRIVFRSKRRGLGDPDIEQSNCNVEVIVKVKVQYCMPSLTAPF